MTLHQHIAQVLKAFDDLSVAEVRVFGGFVEYAGRIGREQTALRDALAGLSNYMAALPPAPPQGQELLAIRGRLRHANERPWYERPWYVEDITTLLAEIDRLAASPPAQAQGKGAEYWRGFQQATYNKPGSLTTADELIAAQKEIARLKEERDEQAEMLKGVAKVAEQHRAAAPPAQEPE